jgi:hypothetical protein
MCIRNLGRCVDVQIPFSGEALYELVEKFGELGLCLLVAITTKRLQHLGGELAALDQRIEDRFLERVERSVGIATEVAPIGVRHASAGETRL